MHGEDRVGFERDCSILAVCLVQYQYFEAGRPLHITGEPLRNIPFDTTTNHMRNSKHPIGIECLVFVLLLSPKRNHETYRMTRSGVSWRCHFF